MLDRVNRWLEIARWAPSGGNQQAWQVRAEDLETTLHIELSVPRELQTSQTDPLGGGLLLGLGCLAKNIEVVAESEGFFLEDTRYEMGERLPETRILLSFSQRLKEPSDYSVEWVENRRTFRGPLEETPVSKEVLTTILKTDSTDSAILFFDLTKEREFFRDLISKIEIWRCTKAPLFQELMSELIFSFDKSAIGIPTKSLGVSMGARAWLLLCRLFPSLQIFFEWGMKGLYKLEGVDQPLKRCGGFYLLSNQDSSARGWFQLGCRFQEIWLRAHSQNIGLQPFLGFSLLAQGILEGRGQEHFTVKERDLVRVLNESLKTEFAMDLKMPLMFFRMGRPLSQPIVSPRRKLEADYQTDLVRAFESSQKHLLLSKNH